MKILVPVKRTVDANVHVSIKQDGCGIEDSNVKMGINPFCEIAVEEALRLKEAGYANEVITVSVGGSACEDVLRHALAMGADQGILIKTDDTLQPLAVTKALKIVVQRELPELVILGKQAIDSDNNQTGQMLAALLGWSQGTFASKVEFQGNRVIVTREIDAGLETIALTLPAVITTDLRLNEPRYLSLPNIMKARKKEIEYISIEEMDIDKTPHQKLIEINEPSKRSAGVRVSTVKELVEKLRNEARII